MSRPFYSELADGLDRQRLHRFVERLRAVTLSITNNIVEGSGSNSKAGFANFLNTARRSIFEVANILILLSRHRKLDTDRVPALLDGLEEQSRMILAFIRRLKS